MDLFDQPIPSAVTRLTFNQAMRLFTSIYWRTKKMHKNTKSFERYLVSYFDGRFIEAIGRQDVENMRTYMHQRHSLGISAVNKCHMIMELLYNKLEDWKEDGWADGYDFSGLTLPRRNPGALVDKVKEPAGTRFITPWEFRKIYHFTLNLGDHELADMIRFGIWSRLSPIDLLNLNDSEINETRFHLEVYRRHTMTTKNPLGCLQVVPLTEKMWGLIERRRRYRNKGETKIFIAKNMRRRLAKIRKLAINAGMEDFTLRDLRRSGSGHLHEKGVDLETRADGLGHRTTRMTKAHYTPNTKPHLKKSSEILVESF